MKPISSIGAALHERGAHLVLADDAHAPFDATDIDARFAPRPDPNLACGVPRAIPVGQPQPGSTTCATCTTDRG
jgi:hypothetical protein